MSADLRIACLEERSRLEALVGEWLDLLDRSDVASPFLTPGWQFAWLDSYGAGRALRVLTAHRDERLVGLWPLARRKRGPFTALEPIGAGRSDWLDILTTADDREAVLAGFTSYLAERARDWDLLECRDVLGTSPSLPVLAKIAPRDALRFRLEPRTVAPYLALESSWEQYLGSKSPKTRSTLKYKRRHAERSCPGFAMYRHEWRGDDPVVNELAEVELRSWKARKGNIKVSTPHGREFYRRFCAYFADRGQLDIWRADGHGRLLAFLVNIRFGGKCYHYSSCFDEEFSDLSLGLLLHAEAISSAFAEGLAEYDFLSGDESYKERWSSAKREIVHTALYNPRLRSRAAFNCLVAARWAFRRSPRLREARARLLALSRQLLRRRET